MFLRNALLFAAATLCASPAFSATYYAGLEDLNKLDYDYNDTVFHVSGDNLMLHSSASWHDQPSLGESGMPFWNHESLDAPKDNVGYCIYGGGSCHGGMGLSPDSKYLASDPTSEMGSANDVTFTADGMVTLMVDVQTTKGMDVLGWYMVSDPTSVMWLTSGSNGMYMFTPEGEFGLVGRNLKANGGADYTYYSQSNYGDQDSVSHFAFFGQAAATATPEPASLTLMGAGLLAAAGILRRRR